MDDLTNVEGERPSAKESLREALTHAGEDARWKELSAKLERSRITPDKEIPQMEFLFSMFCKPCFPRGELVAVAGKAKSGKTFISSMLMTLCFRREVLSFRRLEQRQLRVLWFDTEQSEESTQDILKNRILPMVANADANADANLFDDGLFHVFNVRGEFFQNRLPMLEVAITNFAPDLVILDGIRDLVGDINDGVMAQNVIERLMKLASDVRCCLVCVLHQNKAAEDKNLRGWIGTELKNKAFEVYECVKDENRVFSLSQTDTRKYDIVDKLKYIVDADGIPTEYSVDGYFAQNQSVPSNPLEGRPLINPLYLERYDGKNPVIRVALLFSDALQDVNMMIEGKLRTRVMDISQITTGSLFYRCLNQAVNQGVIIRSTDVNGKKYYRLNVQQKPTTSPIGE